MDIRLGYACVNMSIGRSPNRTTTLKYLTKLDEAMYKVDYLYRKIEENIENLEAVVDWNIENKIYVYRIPSEFFPFVTNEDISPYYDPFKRFGERIKKIGKKALEHNMRFSFHPGQHCVLSSPTESVVEYTLREIEYNARVLDLLGTNDATIVIHGGGKYGDIKSAQSRFIEAFGRLSESARKKLVIENDQTIYTPDEIYYLSVSLGVPFIYDTTHHIWNNGLWSPVEAVIASNESWKAIYKRPKFHLSSDVLNATRHQHDEFIRPLDLEILIDHLWEGEVTSADIMLECKAKDLAVLRLREQGQSWES